jgi:hypothetical protein
MKISSGGYFPHVINSAPPSGLPLIITLDVCACKGKILQFCLCWLYLWHIFYTLGFAMRIVRWWATLFFVVLHQPVNSEGSIAI